MSYLAAFRVIDGDLYFSAVTPSTGNELFVVDRQSGGAKLVYDMAPGTASSNARAIGKVNGKLIVYANLPDSGVQLWALDGGAPVRLTQSVDAQFPPSGAQELLNLDGRMLVNPTGTLSTIVTDGTPQGTRYLTSPNASPPLADINAGMLCRLPGAAVYETQDPQIGRRLVRSDGTEAGTYPLAGLGALVTYRLDSTTYLGDACYHLFTHGTGWSLWRSNGTVAGTGEIASAANAEPMGLHALNGNLFIVEKDTVVRLVRVSPTDPSQRETIFQVTPTNGTTPRMWRVDDKLVLAVYVPGGQNVYLSDGTIDGTRLVQPPAGRFMSSGLHGLGAIAIVDGGTESYRLDTATGVTAAVGFPARMQLSESVRAGNLLIGPGKPGYGNDDGGVWATDGTDAGTTRLFAVAPTTQDSIERSSVVLPLNVAVAPNVLFYSDGRCCGRIPTLWRTDGSSAGTRALPAEAVGGTEPYSAIPFDGGVLVKTREDQGLQARLYKTDAELAGVTLLAQMHSGNMPLAAAGATAFVDCGSTAIVSLCAIAPGQASPVSISPWMSFGIAPFGTLGNLLFFNANGSETWRSDGTAPGTFRIAQTQAAGSLRSVGASSSIHFGGKLFFVSCTQTSECALATSDGTAAGTSVLRNLPSAYAAKFAAFGDGFVFALQAMGPATLWYSDGTAAGTVLLEERESTIDMDFAVVGNRVHFVAGSSWNFFYTISDGTLAGTRRLEFPPHTAPSPPALLAALDDNTAVFGCLSNPTGSELCVTDREGTDFRLIDIYPGPVGSEPRLLGKTADALYVAADDGAHGFEPWQLRVLSDTVFADDFE